MNGNEPSRVEWIEAALQRYEGPLIRYASRITGDGERAREVVQDTFERLCAAERAKVDGRLAAWLYTVCRNRAMDVRRREGRMSTLHAIREEAMAGAGEGPGEIAARNQVQAVVLQVLQRLPGDQAEAFCLKFQDQLTYREIGEVMGVSLGTVSNLITAALATVREQLRASGHLAQEG